MTEKIANNNLRGVLLALLGALCWGFSATCVSYLTSIYHVDVVWLDFDSNAISGPIVIDIAFAPASERRKSLC